MFTSLKNSANTICYTLILPAFLCSFFAINQVEAGSKGNILKAIGKASRSYRNTASEEGALTEKMIEDCIKLKRSVNTTASEAKTILTKVKKLKKEADSLKAYLKKKKTTIDKSSSKAIADYNKKIERYNANLKKHESLRKLYNKKVDLYQNKSSQFNKECSDQPYYKDDYQKVVKKLGYGM